MGKTSEAQKRASMEYAKRALEPVRFDVPKGKKDIIKRAAAARGKSMAQYIIDLIEQDCGEKIR